MSLSAPLWEILGTILVGREVAREWSAVWLRVETRGEYDVAPEVSIMRFPVENVRLSTFRQP